MTVADDTTSRSARMKQTIVDAASAIHDRVAPRVDARKVDHLAGILERFETDYAPHLQAILTGVLESPELSEGLRGLLGEVTTPTHFTTSVLLGLALGSTLGPVIGTAIAPEIQGIANVTWAKNPSLPNTPDLLAAAVIKNVISEADAAGIAALSGVNTAAFHRMVETAGQSLGPQEALALWNRGPYVEADVDNALRYSNINPKFYDGIKALRYNIPSLGEIITGVLKGHLDPTEGRVMAAQTGTELRNFDWMLASAGRPYGTMEALNLLNRGKITEARVRQVVAQSDINPDYTDDILNLRVYLPPPRSVVPMLRSGAITEARALALLEAHGLQPEDAAAFVKEAQTTKASAGKELTGSQVARMYGARFLPRAAAESRLQTAGYPADEAKLLLDFADDNRTEKLLAALTAKVGALYTAHKLDKASAVQALNVGPVPADAQADLFRVWDLERAAMVHHPTTAQVVGAFRRTEITALETRTRLLDLGVQPADLGIIVADGWPPTKGAEAKAAANAVVNA